mgnify:CR=1 FL=1
MKKECEYYDKIEFDGTKHVRAPVMCGDDCPDGCKLPRVCQTCGYEPCANFDSGADDEIMDCWIPPYYWNKGGTDEQYWPFADEI